MVEASGLEASKTEASRPETSRQGVRLKANWLMCRLEASRLDARGAEVQTGN